MENKQFYEIDHDLNHTSISKKMICFECKSNLRETINDFQITYYTIDMYKFSPNEVNNLIVIIYCYIQYRRGVFK